MKAIVSIAHMRSPRFEPHSNIIVPEHDAFDGVYKDHFVNYAPCVAKGAKLGVLWRAIKFPGEGPIFAIGRGR
jgi:hypothetical protein